MLTKDDLEKQRDALQSTLKGLMKEVHATQGALRVVEHLMVECVRYDERDAREKAEAEAAAKEQAQATAERIRTFVQNQQRPRSRRKRS
jgi:hypothetical protein